MVLIAIGDGKLKLVCFDDTRIFLSLIHHITHSTLAAKDAYGDRPSFHLWSSNVFPVLAASNDSCLSVFATTVLNPSRMNKGPAKCGREGLSGTMTARHSFSFSWIVLVV